jgi:GT2 family glycosyltransferase
MQEFPQKTSAVICLAYGREDLTAKTLAHNLPIAGMPFGLFVINKRGIAKALNKGLHEAYLKGYDNFTFIANDILEPEDWLKKRVDAIKPDCGMISIALHDIQEITYTDVIGNILITRETVDKIGYFNESMGDYAPIDNDYNSRCRALGLRNYYVPGHALHLDPSSDTIYGYSKKGAINSTWNSHEVDNGKYQNGDKAIYIPYTIDQPEFP